MSATTKEGASSKKTETRYKSSAGVLTPPTSETSPEFNSRKRKRESSNSADDLLKDTFTIKPHRDLSFSKPRTLHPILLLPRTELKLSYLDNGASQSTLPKSQFFESHIKVLELESRFGNGSVVLIALLDDEKFMYAIEREEGGLYVLCKLGSWVDLKLLRAAAIASRPEHTIETSEMGGSFVNADSVSLITPGSSRYSKTQKAAIEAMMQEVIKKPRVQTPAIETPPSGISPASVEPSTSAAQRSADDLEGKDKPLPTSEIVEPTAPELLHAIRSQYFEALYISKASLAYFPKGPLSRARTAFHVNFDSTLDMSDMIEFLESMILTTSIMDKKYKEGVPELVKKMAVEFLSGDEANKQTKKRRSKKMKPGKKGLYPCEDEFIRKWVNNNTREDDIGMLNDSAIKSCVAELRARETQLQMILLLEVLSLKSENTTANEDGDLPSATSKDNAENQKEKRSKGKRPEELEALIDLHIDRLCIWQEASEGSVSQDKSPFEPNPASGVLDKISKHEANTLRDFCVEVIGPFFTPRLPEKCTDINRKLGGPMAKPPSRPKLAKSASASDLRTRPGAATKRPALEKSSSSLQRVLTNERRARSNSRGTPDSAAISLMRSVSMSTTNVPRLKRETSEAISFSSIPLTDSQSSRGNALKKRYLQREVDLSVPASVAAELKSKKQAAVASELQDAIAALKKPNRQLAGRVLAETAEERASTGRSGRKTTKPIRNPLFQAVHGVQIEATPKHARHKDMMAAPKSKSIHATPLKSSPDMILASSASRIPESIFRPRSTAVIPSSAAPHAHPSRSTFNIAESPSRPASRSHSRINRFENEDLPPSSPVLLRSPDSPKEDFQFAVPDSVTRNPFNAKNGNRGNLSIIEATPTKPRGRSLGSFAPPNLPSFSQRRDSSVSASSAKITKSQRRDSSVASSPAKLTKTVDFANVKEKERRRDSSVSASSAKLTKSLDFASVKGKENLAPPVVEAEADEKVDIIKAFGWDDDFDDLIPA